MEPSNAIGHWPAKCCRTATRVFPDAGAPRLRAARIAALLFSFRSAQGAGQETRGSLIDAHPRGMAQEAVDLVGDDEFFIREIPRFEAAREIDGLLKRHIAVVVPLDQQHGRLPAVDVRVRR